MSKSSDSSFKRIELSESLESFGAKKTDEINKILDISIKILSISFTFCMIIGSWVVWSYLNKVDMGTELPSVISAPQILISIAIYSLNISIGAISVFILVPAAIGYCSGATSDLEWANALPMHRFLFAFCVIFFPLVLFVIMVLLDFNMEEIPSLIVVMSLISSFLFYRVYGGALNTSKKSVFKHYFLVFLASLVAYLLLAFSLVFIFGVAEYLGDEKTKKVFILIVIIFFYGISSAFASSSPSFSGYIPICIVALLIILIMFASNASTNVVSKFGIGAYKSSYTIDPKYLVGLENPGLYRIDELDSGKVKKLTSVWVVISTPSRLIFSSSKSSSDRYSIPRSAILSEFKSAF